MSNQIVMISLDELVVGWVKRPRVFCVAADPTAFINKATKVYLQYLV